tara:strand:+ start:129 stop:362 length:234 start_codon:yes stop_codon:yes gene_type:complete
MNDTSVLIYFLLFAVVVGMTFSFMYVMMRTTINEFNKPRINIHPEMEEVQSGDELLVFTMDEDDEDGDEGSLTIVRK